MIDLCPCGLEREWGETERAGEGGNGELDSNSGELKKHSRRYIIKWSFRNSIGTRRGPVTDWAKPADSA